MDFAEASAEKTKASRAMEILDGFAARYPFTPEAARVKELVERLAPLRAETRDPNGSAESGGRDRRARHRDQRRKDVFAEKNNGPDSSSSAPTAFTTTSRRSATTAKRRSS